MNKIDFNIELFIEQYGIKNLRICWPNKPVDFNNAAIPFMQMGLVLTSSHGPETMAMHAIDEKSWKSNPGYKLTMVPDDVYKVTIVDGDDKPVATCNAFANVRATYVSDFNRMMETGHGSLYLVTEDGYDLLFGVYPEVTTEEEIQAENWASNVFNMMQVQQQTN
jgi:hypothetical protein